MATSTDSGASVRWASVVASSRAQLVRVHDERRSPADVQIFRYFRATRPGRNGRMNPYRMGSHSARGSSTTRGSRQQPAQEAPHISRLRRRGRAGVHEQHADAFGAVVPKTW